MAKKIKAKDLRTGDRVKICGAVYRLEELERNHILDDITFDAYPVNGDRGFLTICLGYSTKVQLYRAPRFLSLFCQI